MSYFPAGRSEYGLALYASEPIVEEGGSRSMTKDRRLTFRCARLTAAALALGIVTSAGLVPVSAQDASPAASPAAVACESPGLPPGTPTPMDEMGDMDMGTPVGESEEAGSPVAVEEA